MYGFKASKFQRIKDSEFQSFKASKTQKSKELSFRVV